VKAQISSALARSGGLFDERDYVGEVDGSNFSLWINSPVMTWGLRYGSTLIGDVIESDKTHTDVIIRFRSSLAFKLLAVLAVLLGIIFLFRLINEYSIDSLLWGLAMIFLGPVICNWFAGVSNASLQSRYVTFIHRPLKSK
jgi:hypothetical protein